METVRRNITLLFLLAVFSRLSAVSAVVPLMAAPLECLGESQSCFNSEEECCSGLYCAGDAGESGCTTCAQVGEFCDSAFECCGSGLNSCEWNQCCIWEYGSGCNQDTECCGNIPYGDFVCVAGECVTCIDTFDHGCEEDTDCCEYGWGAECTWDGYCVNWGRP
jgi:hypothetical protein